MERGDVLELRAPRSARGHGQGERRYAVIVQGEEFWPASTLTVAPTSRAAQARRYRPEIRLRNVRTTVLVDQLTTYDVDRFGDRVARVSRHELDQIDAALKLFLGLDRLELIG